METPSTQPPYRVTIPNVGTITVRYLGDEPTPVPRSFPNGFTQYEWSIVDQRGIELGHSENFDVSYPADSLDAITKLLNLLYIRERSDLPNPHFNTLHDLAGLSGPVAQWADENREAIEAFTADLSIRDIRRLHSFDRGVSLN